MTIIEQKVQAFKMAQVDKIEKLFRESKSYRKKAEKLESEANDLLESQFGVRDGMVLSALTLVKMMLKT
jgi:hypothetical protein